MKKIINILCCASGGGLIGFSANHLNTASGSICFVIGIAILVFSSISIAKTNR